MKKNTKLFLVICACMFLVSEFTKYLLGINELLFENLLENISYERASKLFENARKWQLIGYIFIPVYLLLKTHLIASILSFGNFLYEKEVAYAKLLEITLKAEVIFIFVGLIKSLWLYFFIHDFNLNDVQNFYPLSLLNLIEINELEPWYIYPLQTLNMFELAYWITLIILLNRSLNSKKKSLGFKIVASSYGPALLVWVVTIMFVTLNMS